MNCRECGSSELIKDYYRCEIYCAKCGLVMMDSQRNLFKSKKQNTDDKQHYYAMKRFLINFEIAV